MKTLADLKGGDVVAVMGRAMLHQFAPKKASVIRCTPTTIKVSVRPDDVFMRSTGLMRGSQRLFIEPWDEETHPAMIAEIEYARIRRQFINKIRALDLEKLSDSQLVTLCDLIERIEKENQ